MLERPGPEGLGRSGRRAAAEGSLAASERRRRVLEEQLELATRSAATRRETLVRTGQERARGRAARADAELARLERRQAEEPGAPLVFERGPTRTGDGASEEGPAVPLPGEGRLEEGRSPSSAPAHELRAARRAALRAREAADGPRGDAPPSAPLQAYRAAVEREPESSLGALFA
jgi:hypothetical protein